MCGKATDDGRLCILRLQNSIGLFIVRIDTCNRKAVPHLHVRLGLRHQRIADVLPTAAHPSLKALVAQWVDWHVAHILEEFTWLGRRVAHDVVNIALEFFAVGLQRQIVDVIAKGVFDLAADGGNAEDDVGSEDAAWDGDPVEILPELERQHHDIDPGYLRDGNRVGDGKRGLEDAFHADEDFVQLNNRADFCMLARERICCVVLWKERHTSLILVEGGLD
jgi:hypothetical protein